MHDGNKPGADGPTAASAPPVRDGRVAPEQTVDPESGPPVEVADGGPSADVPEPASVHVIVMAERTRIVLSGEIDADLVPELQEAAADAEATGLPIEVDAQHVTFMDSSGIAFLARVASRSTGHIRVLHAPDAVRFLLDVTKIGELVDLVEDASTDVGPTASPRIGLATPPAPDDAA